MTAEVRLYIRRQLDELARIRIAREATQPFVNFCERCGAPFDLEPGSRRTVCCRISRAKPTPVLTVVPVEERLQRKRERQRAYRHTPAGRASHARSQARWRQSVAGRAA